MLANRVKDGRFRRYYMTVPDASKLDIDSRIRLVALARKVAELSPDILVIALDVDLLADDEANYGVIALRTPLAQADHAQ